MISSILGLRRVAINTKNMSESQHTHTHTHAHGMPHKIKTWANVNTQNSSNQTKNGRGLFAYVNVCTCKDELSIDSMFFFVHRLSNYLVLLDLAMCTLQSRIVY